MFVQRIFDYKMIQKNLASIFLICFLFFFVFQPFSASAQIPGEGLTISPPLSEYSVKPGEKITATIKITNPTTKLMEVYPVVMNFKAKGEGGEPAFYPARQEEEKFSLASWIKFSQTKIALTPEQVVEFNYQIEVPAGAEPGGHYGVIFFATEPPKPEADVSQVAIASMIGSLVLVKVPGAIIEKGFLEEFSAKKFYFKPPVNFIIRISNLGNIHFRPQGEITIKNWRGKNLEQVPINQQKGSVLPDSTRKFEEKWSPSKTCIGRFSAHLRVVYGESEKTLGGQLTFWIIPWWLIAIVIVFILILVFVVWYFRKRKKRRRGVKGGEGQEIKVQFG